MFVAFWQVALVEMPISNVLAAGACDPVNITPHRRHQVNHASAAVDFGVRLTKNNTIPGVTGLTG